MSLLGFFFIADTSINALLFMLRKRRSVILITLGSICVCSVYVSLRLYLKDSVKEEKRPNLGIRKSRDYVDVDIHDSFFLHQFDQQLPKNRKLENGNNRNGLGNLNLFQHRKGKKPPCVPFTTWRGTIKICTHDPKQDRMISAFIHSYGTWEENFLNATGEALTSHPEMTFIDLGCNIGAYTLFVASLGVQVVSVDAFDKNLELLAESLEINSLKPNVTLVHNAISDKHENVTLEVVSNNVGGSYVKTLSNSQKPTQNIVSTILLDDLIPLVKNTDVFIKMDIEGTELKALKAAKTLLHFLNVKFILMEWVLHRNKQDGLEIIEIMTNNGFLPYWDHRQLFPLKVYGHIYWPENVFWIKR